MKKDDNHDHFDKMFEHVTLEECEPPRQYL